MRTLVSISIGSMMMLVGSFALAQEGTGGTATGTAGGTATVTTPTVPTPPPPHEGGHHAAPPVDDTPDHERVIKKLAIGYLGFNQVPLTGTESVAAPVIGARYWLFDRMGVDAGIGFGVKGGSQETNNNNTKVTIDQATAWAFAIHAGVPLSPAWGKHYTLLLIPEINFGYAGRSIKPPANSPANTPNTDQNGARFEIGARAGGEVHFGFIGVPELSLQATIGLGFQNNQVWSSSGANTSTSAHSYTFTTSVDQAPWAIFTNNISALYYFP
jgi:hypothetical protein